MQSQQTNYRYFGDISFAKLGVITVATKLNRESGKAYIGVSLTPPNTKFDKQFARLVADYRLSRSLEDLNADATFSTGLASVRSRVRKSVKRTRLSQEDYLTRRANSVGKDGLVNIGYFEYETTYFELSDFQSNITDFVFAVAIDEKATHSEIDDAILDVLENSTTYPKWVYAITELVREEPEFEDGDDEDEEYETDADADADEEESSEDEELTVEEVNESFANIVIVQSNEGVYLSDAGSAVIDGESDSINADDLDYKYSLSPIFNTRAELVAWLEDLTEVSKVNDIIDITTDSSEDSE